mgnify:CR=1 FL=1
MPSVFLSPSTQEYNPYITGAGSEEYFMNLIADAMEPYLTANTIRFGRNTPEMTAASSIRRGNAGDYDFYLALHSNASTDGSREGFIRGIIAFYYPGSANGQRAADIFVRNLQTIYPLPEKVYARSTTTLGEVRQPRMPAVRRCPLDTKQRPVHRRQPCIVPDGVFRSAVHHAHYAVARHGTHPVGKPESAGISVPVGEDRRAAAVRHGGDGLRPHRGMVQRGLSGPSGLCRRRVHPIGGRGWQNR